MVGQARLSRAFYARSPLEVAPALLNKVLVAGDRGGRIVEVEAYLGEQDPASHAFRGPTPRTAVMFGPAGHLYVYFSYGMHWCANVVADAEGVAGAVLIRALEPVRAVEAMEAARPRARRPVDVANGPAKATEALGIDGSFDGLDLTVAEMGVTIVDDGFAPPVAPAVGPRVGITQALDKAWRFSVPGSKYRSRPTPVP